MDVDSDAHTAWGSIADFDFRLDKDAAGFARADEQVVGPAEIDGQSRGGADRIGGGDDAPLFLQGGFGLAMRCAVWVLAIALIYAFSGQSSKFIYIDF